MNQDLAKALGWVPTLFGVPGFGPALDVAIRAFQGQFPDLIEDGICGHATFRRLILDRAPSSPVEHEAPAASDHLLIGGQAHDVKWDRVVVPGEVGALELRRGFSRRSKRKVDKVITHWDVCIDAHDCYKVLNAKGISTHFVIDWDGTIYQLVDLAHEAWHAGIGWINRSSIGIDFSTPVYPKYQDKAVARGQDARPIISGWRINGWGPGPFLGPHQAQLDAYAALLEAIHRHLGVPLDCVGGTTARLKYQRKKAIGPGIYHHAEVDYPRKRKDGKIRRSGKWDTAGVDIPTAIEMAVAA